MGRSSKREKSILSKNISRRAKELGLTGIELAAKAKLHYPTVRDVMAGISAGREDTKEALAKALGCTVSDLYKLESVHPNMSDLSSGEKRLMEILDKRLSSLVLTKDEMELVMLFRLIPDEHKQSLIRSAKDTIALTAKRKSKPADAG